MDLFELSAKLKLDDADFNKGIGNAESAGQKLGKSMSAMAVTVGNAMYDLLKKGASAVGNTIKGAVDAFGNYQQLVGGVETLFGKSAGKVQKYAANAFKTAGLSANAYMETVTSFSASLLQGLGGDTEAAAEIANMAIIDMADNANKMGTDMQSIQNAYMGFAKGNYTMLDNLKLGYGGTKSEMLRLVNSTRDAKDQVKSLDQVSFPELIKAIHEVQAAMGVTDTTKNEAEATITGSAAAMQAAWENLLTTISGGGEEGTSGLDAAMNQFKESFGTYMTNLIPTILETVGNSGSLVQAIANGIADLPKTLLSDVGENALEAGTDMVQAVGKITSWVIDSLVNMFKTVSASPDKILEFGASLGEFIGNTLSQLATNSGAILEGAMKFGASLTSGILQGLWEGLFGETKTEAKENAEELADAVAGAEVNDIEANALIKYLEDLYTRFGEAASAESSFQESLQKLDTYLPGAGKVFEQYGSNVQGAINKLKDLAKEQRKLALQSALEKSRTGLINLIGEQRGNIYVAEQKQIAAGNAIEAARQKATESLTAYAQQALDMNAKYQEQNPGYSLLNDTDAKWASDLLNMDLSGFDVADIAKMAEGMATILNSTIENAKHEGIETTPVWDESQIDLIIPPEAISKIDSFIAEKEQEIATATEDIKAAQIELSAAEEQLQYVEGAMATMMEKLEAGEESFSALIKSSGDELYYANYDLAGNLLKTGMKAETASKSVNKMNTAASGAAETLEKIAGIRLPGGATGHDETPDLGAWAGGRDAARPHKATGMDWIPWDGYKAELHRGEAILTAAENRQRLNGSLDPSQLAEIMRDAIREGMRGVQVQSYLNGRDITQDVNRETMRQLRARRYSG